MKIFLKTLTISILILVNTVFAASSSQKHFGFIKNQDVKGITKVLSFPIADLVLIHNNKEIYGLYPKKHSIDIFYKDKVIARLSNPSFSSDYLINIIEKFRNLKNTSDSKVIFLLGPFSQKATRLYEKNVRFIKKIILIENASDNEDLIM